MPTITPRRFALHPIRALHIAACSGALLLCQRAAPAQNTAPANAPNSGGISLADAISTAQSASPTLVAAQARFEAAQARLRGAAARVVPQLIIARAFGRDTGGFDEDILLSQTFELGKRGPRLRSARALGTAAGFERAAGTAQLRFDVQSAYFEALRAQSEAELSQSALATSLAFDNAAKTQLQAGDVPRANVVRSEIEVERARQALDDAQIERDNRFATLASLLGQSIGGASPGGAINSGSANSGSSNAASPNGTPPNGTSPNGTSPGGSSSGLSNGTSPSGSSSNARLQLADKLAFEPTNYDEAALQALALTQRADLAGAGALQRAREADVLVARSIGRPDAFVEARRAGLTRYSGLPQGQSIRFGVSLPLGGGSRRAAVGEAQAAQREGVANAQETLRVARLEVSTSLASLENAARTVRSFQNGRLNRSRELLDMAQIGYERGANSYLELLDAQNVYRAEQLAYNRALASWNIARASLERAVGGRLP